jgi:leucyl-tRNA synthetase
MGPFDQSIAWSTNGIKGVKKFLEKIIALKDKISNEEEEQDTKIILHQSIKKLTEDIDGFRFNTAISQLMILVNHLTDCKNINKKTFEDLVVLVSPFAPHLAEELREQLGNEYSLFTKATWPAYDEKYLVADTVTIGVQVNGKVRGTITISKETEEIEVMQLAKADEKIATRITGEPKKVIYVKGKILNIVV